MKPPIEVVLVDDHAMFREGIRARLEREPDFTVVGEAASADQALTLIKSLRPAVVIVDIRMPEKTGIELARQLRQQWPDVKILILSGYDFDQYVRALSRIGIQGYLLKDSPQDQLVEALREIAEGGVVLPPQIASKVMRDLSTRESRIGPRSLCELTLREIEILEHLHEGLTNAAIAERLTISTRTVESHVRSIASKLGAKGRAQAVRIAIESGLIK